MKLFHSFKKQSTTESLLGSIWICTTGVDAEASYYKLEFTSDEKVLGWVKFSNADQEEKVFTASYKVERNRIDFSKEKDSFFAFRDKDKIVAIIEETTLYFERKVS
ncbi:MAG: hypothetical protein VW080_04750 [Flavobacteriaceae bacterium]